MDTKSDSEEKLKNQPPKLSYQNQSNIYHTTFREFDNVRIVNRANIKWLYTDHCDLGGLWVVVGLVGSPDDAQNEQLILSVGEHLIRIPKLDVQKVSAYSTSALLDHIKGISGYG